MPPILPLRYEIWSDIEAPPASGVRLAVISADHILGDGPERYRNVRTGDDTLTVPLWRLSPAWVEAQQERVFRVVWPGDGTDFDEYRIKEKVEAGEEDGRLLGELRCEGIRFDLLSKSGPVERIEANGLARLTFDVLGRTPLEAVRLNLGELDAYTSGAPSYFNPGTVEPADRLEFLGFRRDTPYDSLKELAEATGAEFDVRRVGTTGYDVDVVFQIGASAKTVLLKYGRNVLGLEHVEGSKNQATRIYPQGENEEATLAENGWVIASISGGIVTLEEDAVGEDDSFEAMGLHARKPDGSIPPVTNSTAPNLVTLSSTAGLAPGDVLTFVRNANGDEISYLDSPSRVNGTGGSKKYGVITRKLDVPDVPPINNLVANPYLVDWSAGLPVSFGVEGNPTVTQNLNEHFFLSGASSARVIANAREGLITDDIAVVPSEARPHFTGQVGVYVVSGSVVLEIWDETDPADPLRIQRWPHDLADHRNRTTAQGRWVPNLIYAMGEDLFDLPAGPTTRLRLKILAAEDGTEFYLDRAQLTQTPEGFPTFFGGRASNVLWLKTLDELFLRRDPLSTWNLKRVIDLNRLAPKRWPDEPLVAGGLVRLRVPEFESDVDGIRIVSLQQLLEKPAHATIQVETELEMLTRQRAAAARRKRLALREPPELTTRPACPTSVSAFFTGDLEVIWDRADGTARYELRDVTGTTGTNEERWAAGTRIYAGDATSFILKAGEKITIDGEPILGPGDIEDLMLETYTRWGVQGRCFQTLGLIPVAALSLDTNCPNLAGADAGEEFCSPVTTANPLYFQPDPGYLPIDVVDAGLTPGESLISYCFAGKTSSSEVGQQFFDDFRNNNSGDAPPAGWTPRWGSTNAAWPVRSGNGAYRMVRTRHGGTWRALSWNVLDGSEDVEMLILAGMDGIDTRNFMGAVVRGGGTDPNRTGYTVAVNNGFDAGTVQLRRWNGDGSSTLLAQGPTINPWGDDTKWFIRLRAEGDQLKVRFFRFGTDEHCTWDLEVTDGTYTSGWAGLASQDDGFSGTESVWVLAAAATGGQTAFAEAEPSFAATTTFKDGSVGTAPAGWEMPFAVPDTFDVVGDPVFSDGKAMRVASGAAGAYHARWDAQPVTITQATMQTMQMAGGNDGSSNNQIGAMVRQAGDQAAARGLSGIAVRFDAGFGGFIQTVAFVDGSASGSSTAFNPGTNRFAVRLEATGADIRSRWWLLSDTEPAEWAHVLTDTKAVEGKVGTLDSKALERRWGTVEATGGGVYQEFCEELDVLAAIDLFVLDASGQTVQEHLDPGVRSIDYVKEAGAQGMKLHESAATLQFRAAKKGSGEGVACVTQLQVNTGSACCAFTTPTSEADDPEVDCLGGLVIGGRTVEPCAGARTMTIPISWEATPDCGDDWDLYITVEDRSEGKVIHREVHKSSDAGAVDLLDGSHTIVVGDDAPSQVTATTEVASDAPTASERQLRVTLRMTHPFESATVESTRDTVLEVFGYNCDAVGDGPAAPTNLVAVETDQCSVDLTHDDNSPDETLWIVERQIDGGGWNDWAFIESSTTVTTGSVTHFDLGGPFEANKLHEFRVSAANDNGRSAPSNVASITPTGSACQDGPNAPALLTVTEGASCKPICEFNDTSTDEDHWEFQRRLDGGNPEIIGQVASDTTPTTGRIVIELSKPMVAGSLNEFRVRSVRGGTVSTWSNWDGVTPAGPCPS